MVNTSHFKTQVPSIITKMHAAYPKYEQNNIPINEITKYLDGNTLHSMRVRYDSYTLDSHLMVTSSQINREFFINK